MAFLISVFLKAYLYCLQKITFAANTPNGKFARKHKDSMTLEIKRWKKSTEVQENLKDKTSFTIYVNNLNFFTLNASTSKLLTWQPKTHIETVKGLRTKIGTNFNSRKLIIVDLLFLQKNSKTLQTGNNLMVQQENFNYTEHFKKMKKAEVLQ